MSHFALMNNGILRDIIRTSLTVAALNAAEVTWSTGYMHYSQSSTVSLPANLSDTASDEQSVAGLGAIRRLRPLLKSATGIYSIGYSGSYFTSL